MSLQTLLINGSRVGEKGNSGCLLETLASRFGEGLTCRDLVLAQAPSLGEIESSLKWAQALIIATGTYWDSWGSPLQRFLEDMTETEGTELWLGKPAVVLVTMHSVGGKGVLSRLQGVLCTFGALIPPMSGVVLSAAAQLAIEHTDSPLCDDLWQVDDLKTAVHNLKVAAAGNSGYRAWEVDRAGSETVWIDAGDG